MTTQCHSIVTTASPTFCSYSLEMACSMPENQSMLGDFKYVPFVPLIVFTLKKKKEATDIVFDLGSRKQYLEMSK